jgi:hypothetical protein
MAGKTTEEPEQRLKTIKRNLYIHFKCMGTRDLDATHFHRWYWLRWIEHSGVFFVTGLSGHCVDTERRQGAHDQCRSGAISRAYAG